MSISIGQINRYGRPTLAPVTATSIVTPPTSFPVGDGIVKSYLRIDADDNSQSDVLTTLTGAATEAVQEYANVSLVSQVRMVTFGWGDFVELPYGPVTAVGVVQVQDTDTGVWSTTTAYVNRGNGFITFDAFGVYRVTYTAGFAVIPTTFQTSVLRHINEHYEIRQGVSLGVITNVIPGMSWQDAAQPKKKYVL